MNPIKLETRDAIDYIYIPIEATLNEWGNVNELVPKLFEWLAAKGVDPAGPPFFRYYREGDEQVAFQLEVGVPTPHALACDGPVHPGRTPAGTYVVAVHHGHPDRLPETYRSMHEWVDRHDIVLDHQDERWGAWFIRFLTHPDEQPDPNQWDTEVAWLTRS